MHLLLAAVLSFGIGGTVGLLGGGGSMLTLPMLVYVLDVAPASAISASLLVVGVTSATGVIAHARAGKVAWRVGAIFGVAGMAGAYGGGHLARRLPAQLLLVAFGVVMLITSLAMMRGRKRRMRSAGPSDPSIPRSIAVGAAVGGLSGLLGAGGGLLIVPALEIVGGLGMLEAIGTSPLVTGMQSFAGFAGRLGHIDLDWRLVGAISAIAVLGSFAGARAAQRLSPALLRRGFAWLVLAVALLLLARQLPLGCSGFQRCVTWIGDEAP